MPVGNPVTDLSGPGNYVPVTRTLTINGVTYDLSANRTWTISTGSVTSVDMTVPNFLAVTGNPITSSGTLAISLVDQLANTIFAGPTSGAESAPVFRLLVADDIPTIDVSKVTNAVPTSRQLTINGTAYDLSADQSWSVGTVTSIGLSSTTTGITIGSTPVTSSGTITIDIDTASSTLTGLLSSSDWTIFNSKLNNPFTALGDLIYSNAGGIGVRRSGNTTTTKMFLSQTGDGTNSAAPQWEAITTTSLGAVPTTRTLTINDVPFDLSADQSWSVGDFGTW